MECGSESVLDTGAEHEVSLVVSCAAGYVCYSRSHSVCSMQVKLTTTIDRHLRWHYSIIS